MKAVESGACMPEDGMRERKPEDKEQLMKGYVQGKKSAAENGAEGGSEDRKSVV